VVLTFVASRGVTRTARVTRAVVAFTLLVLAVVVVVLLTGDHTSAGGLAGPLAHATPYGVLQSAGLLFFAFAGYARIATMGEEVRDPARTIPRAIPAALGIAVAVYLVVAAAALLAVGPQVLAASPAPLEEAVVRAGSDWASLLVRVGAAVASIGALLALLAGVGRTGFAMARNGDLPRWMSAVHERHRVPHRAQAAVGAVVVVLVLATDLRGALGFSSFGVLLYYAVANASAFTQDEAHRRWPRALNLAGVAGCVVLVGALPTGAVLAGTAVVLAGLAGRMLARRR
jgi:APA family basic amino acid/polyamine antiporter